MNPHPASYWTLHRYFRLSFLWFAISTHWAALLAIVLPDLADQFASGEQRGTLLAIVAGLGAAVSAVVQLTVGYYSDRTTSRWGRRRPYLVVGVMLTPIGLLALGWASSYWSFVASVLLIQLTLNLANGPYQAYIPDLVPRQLHGAASMWMGIFQHLGQVVGPLTAGWILSRPDGLPQLTSGLAALLVIGLLVTVTGVEEKQPEGEQTSAHWKEIFQVPLRSFPAFRRLLWSRLVINLGYYVAIDFLLYYVRYSLGVQDYRGGTSQLMALMVVGGLVGGIPAGPLADRHNKVRLIYATNLVTGVAALSFAFVPSLTEARLVGLVLGLGFGAFTVIDWALACNLIPEGGSARYMGVWNLTAVLPQIAAPALLGPVSDLVAHHYGPGFAYRAAMVTVLGFLAVGTFLLRGIEESSGG